MPVPGVGCMVPDTLLLVVVLLRKPVPLSVEGEAWPGLAGGGGMSLIALVWVVVEDFH